MQEQEQRQKVEVSFMNYLSTCTQRLMASSILAIATLATPTLAIAEEVTLTSRDGAINITGELLEFQDGNYVIESGFGPIRVAADQVDCVGDACPGAEVGPVTWDVSVWGRRRAFTENVEKLAELVSEKTGGEFTLNVDYGGLAQSNRNLDGIAAGDFEMAQFCAGYHPEKNPSLMVLELPFLGVETLEQEVAVSLAVYDHPAVKEDLARWNATILMPTPLPQQNLIGAGFPPTSLASFEGMNIRATGGIGDTIASLGGIVANIPAPEVARAMETGYVDAVSFAPHAHMAFGTVDNATWWTTNLNPGTVNCPVVVNTDALNSLSPAYRDALLSSVDGAIDHYLASYNGRTMDAWLPALRERGIMELTINQEIMSSIIANVAEPTAAKWIADSTAAGLPAQEIYDLVQDTITQTN
ncbi:C4-dicarboxylate ABC transporter substrate-binding protein [Yoonia sp. I 8.24]|nr:C4-dicarboxylate ABC transporter substrate-binding protein [Yoonia sp. I 8.24]